jgi:hypothetical protein
MSTFAVSEAIDLLVGPAHPFAGTKVDFDPLLSGMGKAKCALSGDASHGTHEFYKALSNAPLTTALRCD